MKKMKKSSYIIVCFMLIIGCKSVHFGNVTETLDFYAAEEHDVIEKIEVPYKAFINVFPVKGNVLHILGSAVAPDGRLFLVINFPHLGVLVSDDGGKTFSHSLFYSDYFIFQDYENEDSSRSRKAVRRDISVHSIFSDDGKIALSAGPFLFLSNDNGVTWEKKNPFYNLDTSFIRKILCDKNGRLYLFTDNKVAYSDNWGKKWKFSSFKLNDENLRKFQFVDAIFCDDGLYASYIKNDDKISELYNMSYETFSGNKQNFVNSGVFFITQDLKNAKSLGMPPVLFISPQKGFSPFDFSLEDLQLEDGFKKAFFYKTGSLKNGKNSAAYFVKQLSNMETKKVFGQNDEIKAIDIKTGEIALLTAEEKQIAIMCRQNNDSSFFINGTGISKEDYDFQYNLLPLNQLRDFSGGYLRETQIISEADENGDYYRAVLKPELLSGLLNEIMKKKWKRDNSNAFFYKEEKDYNFEIAKLYKKFPFTLEKVSANGEVSNVFTSEMLELKIAPKSRMNRWFWYKNIDKKRQFKLEVLVGVGDNPDMLCVPSKLMHYNGGLLLEISYFYNNNCYRELFMLQLPESKDLL